MTLIRHEGKFIWLNGNAFGVHWFCATLVALELLADFLQEWENG